MPDQDWKTGGLNRQKYVIHKPCQECGGIGSGYFDSIQMSECPECNGSGAVPCDPNAAYFVLRIDCDPETGKPYDQNARNSLHAYAKSVEEQNPQFAADILEWLLATAPMTDCYDEDPPSYGDRMTVEDFIVNCSSHAFIDYDGHGRPMRDGKIARTNIYPSRFRDLPKDATHVMWFNR